MRVFEEPSEANVFRRSDGRDLAKRNFKQQAELIRQGWLKRQRDYARLAKDEQLLIEQPDDWMQRLTYRLIRWLLGRGHQGVLTELIGEVGTRHGSRHDISDQPFKQALLVMFWWHERLANTPLLSRQRRAELGDAMEYARRHKVAPRHFCGFAKQAGLKHIAVKLRVGHWEPGFSPPRPRLSRPA